VPLLSYVVLRGRCRACGARILAPLSADRGAHRRGFAGFLLVHGPAALLVDWALASALIAVTSSTSTPHHSQLDHAAGLVLASHWRCSRRSSASTSARADRRRRDRRRAMGALRRFEYFAGKTGLHGDVKLMAMLASFLGYQGALGTLISAR